LEKEFSERKNNFTIEEMPEKSSKNERICPECGTLVTKAILSRGATGVGQTYAQASRKPFTITYEIVCPRCGLY